MSRCQILAALLGVPPRLLSVAGVHPSTRCWRVRSLRAHVCLLLNHPLPTGDHQWITTSPSIPPRGPAPGPLPIPKSTASLRVDPSCPWLRRADLTLAPSSERKPTANDRLKQDIRTCPLAAKITLQRSQWPRDKAWLRAQLGVTIPPCLPTASLLWS